MTIRWSTSRCAICSAIKAAPLFTIPEATAPRGRCAIVQCRECGLRRLDPRPTDDAISALYGPEYYASKGRKRSPLKQAVWDLLRDVSAGAPGRAPVWVLARPLARRVTRWLFDVNVSPVSPHRKRVVDVGSGYGDLLIYLQSRGHDVLGVELDPEAALAGRRYGVSIHIGTVDQLALEEASVDDVVFQHSLEHMTDPVRALREVSRVTRPGGRLHVAVPNGSSAGLRLQRRSWGCLSFPEHLWYFDFESLKRLLQAHGFTPVDVRYRTIWRNHLALWRSEVPVEGFREVVRRAACIAAAIARDRSGADILRVEAVRTATTPSQEAARKNFVGGASGEY